MDISEFTKISAGFGGLHHCSAPIESKHFKLAFSYLEEDPYETIEAKAVDGRTTLSKASGKKVKYNHNFKKEYL